VDGGFQTVILQEARTSAISLNLIRMNELYRFDIKKQWIQRLIHKKEMLVKIYLARILKAPANS
jgi:hypothetical protein